ncbi:MAG TPA: L,D-transpeptidase family protein [Clostridia bacterium]|nr:L,D-transpeptidase family protein [Clostridia bacterium]
MALPFRPISFLAYPEQVRIVIEIETRTLTLYLGGRVHGVYPVALGKPSTPTPQGDWHIRSKEVNPSWPVLGTRWMGLDIPWGNYGIHGTNAPWSIGRYISNGCIRMHNHHVEEVFDLVPLYTPVLITGTYPGASGRPNPGIPTGPLGTPPFAGPPPKDSSPHDRPYLKAGDKGEDVLRLQRRLVELGYDPGPLDGLFGFTTEAAVREFQRRAGLQSDGIVGPATRLRLGL